MRFTRFLLALSLVGALAAPITASAQEMTTRIVVRKSGWLGIKPELTSEMRDGKATTTLVVLDVVAGSPADKAGVQKGDQIVRIDGKAVSIATFDALTRSMEPGDTVRLRISTNGRERDAFIVAGQRPADYAGLPLQDIVIMRTDSASKLRKLFMDSARFGQPLDSLMRRFGEVRVFRERMPGDSLLFGEFFFRDSLPGKFKFEMFKPGEGFFEMRVPHIELLAGGGRMGVAGAEFTELNPGLSQYFGTSKGLLVLRVGPGTPAARAGLEAGDVLTRVDGREVESVEQFRVTVFRTRESSLKLDILRKGKSQSLTLEMRRSRE